MPGNYNLGDHQITDSNGVDMGGRMVSILMRLPQQVAVVVTASTAFFPALLKRVTRACRSPRACESPLNALDCDSSAESDILPAVYSQIKELEDQNRRLREENESLRQRVDDNVEYAMETLTFQNKEIVKSNADIHNSLLAIEQYLGDGFNIIDKHANAAQGGNVRSMGPKVMLGVFTSVASQIDCLRRQMYDYLPQKHEHIGGTTITFAELKTTIEKAVGRFGFNPRYAIEHHVESRGVDDDHILFHDMNYMLRLLYFACEFVHATHNPQLAAPQLTLVFERLGKAKCVFSLRLRVPRKNLLPRDFNEMYQGYFWGNTMPMALAMLHPDLVAALKMSASYSVLVSMETDDFGNDTLVFNRMTYLSKSMAFFREALELRRRIPASDVFYVASDGDEHQEDILSFIHQHSSMECSIVSCQDFSPGIICRARRVIIGPTVPENIREGIAKSIVTGPFVRVNITVMGAMNKPLDSSRISILPLDYTDDVLFNTLL